MRIIDADKLLEAMGEYDKSFAITSNYKHTAFRKKYLSDFAQMIDKQPTVDVSIHNDYKQLYEETRAYLDFVNEFAGKVMDRNAQYIETIQELKGKLNENKDS